MARDYALKFDVEKLTALSEDLGGFSADTLGKARVSALNKVVEDTDKLARDRMTAGINLSDAYLRRKMRVELATASRPVASITASGARSDLTVLGRYDAKPRIVANKSQGKRKGYSGLGIAPGQKQAGVTVQVSKGKTSVIETGFLMPLRRGNEAGGNGFGVFTRSRSGKVRHRYGPSVYQLFAYQVRNITEEVGDDLQDTFLDEVEGQLQKALSQ